MLPQKAEEQLSMLIHGLSFLEQLAKHGLELKSKSLTMMELRLNRIIKAQSL